MSLQGTRPDLHLTLQVRPLCPFYAFTLEPLMTVRPPTVNLTCASNAFWQCPDPQWSKHGKLLRDCRPTSKQPRRSQRAPRMQHLGIGQTVQDKAFADKSEEGDPTVVWALSKALRGARKSPNKTLQPLLTQDGQCHQPPGDARGLVCSLCQRVLSPSCHSHEGWAPTAA